MAIMGSGNIVHPVARDIGRHVRAWHETGGSVVAAKLVNHDDETNHRPPVGIPLEIYVEPLSRCARIQRPGEHRTELEGATDDLTTHGEQRLVEVKLIEGGAAIDPHAVPLDDALAIAAQIADALDKGAELISGGLEPEGDAYAKGYFFRPTVLGQANHSMRVMREETFGPVAPIMKFKTMEEAVTLANDSEYGLAAYIYTNDLKTALQAAEGLEAGGIGVNANNVVDLQAPFGGWKQSGLGRELGHYGLEAYLETKHIRLGM